MSTIKNIGRKGEQLTREYLKREGYAILESNWKFKKTEIDLIAQKENTICFIEVKTRSEYCKIEPILAVSLHQQKRILLGAHHYIEQNSLDQEVRFDVIGIIYNNKQNKLKHIKEAFYPTID